jgi:hypothetical protein
MTTFVAKHPQTGEPCAVYNLTDEPTHGYYTLTCVDPVNQKTCGSIMLHESVLLELAQLLYFPVEETTK